MVKGLEGRSVGLALMAPTAAESARTGSDGADHGR